jgi:hypothetical protein
VPTVLELAIVLAIGLLTLVIAIGEFSRPE